VHEIGTDQPALLLRKGRVGGQGIFHFIGARLEYFDEIAVTALEILEDISQLFGSRFGIERQDSIDDMIRPRFVGGIEVSRLGRRPEWAHDNSCRIRAKIKTLTVQNLGSDKMSLESTE
jgi:hypothetical protein